MNYQTHIILARGIKLDREYQNILNYTEDEMLNLVNTNKINEVTNASFVQPLDKSRAYIDYPISFTNIMSANYLAFKNINYGNKWFFAFIDKIEYISNKNCRIYFTIDEMATWWDYWWYQNCFVEREHVSNDSIGANTIDEGLPTGEYIVSHKEQKTYSNLWYVISTSTGFKRDDVGSQLFVIDENKVGGKKYCGIYSANYYYYSDSVGDIQNAILELLDKNKIDAINGVFLCPVEFLDVNPDYKVGASTMYELPASNTPKLSSGTFTFVNQIGYSVDDKYTPRNNKIHCYPFSSLVVDNSGGQTSIYKREYIDSLTKAIFNYRITSVITPGISSRLTPIGYKYSSLNFSEGINLAKFPICNYPVDMYTVWNSQQLTNVLGDLIGDNTIVKAGLTAGIGMATVSSPEMLGTALDSILSKMTDNLQHSILPTVTRGNVNSGDVVASNGEIGFHMYQMTITPEVARKLDSFFDRFGYKVMRTKLPEFVSRENWNYVKIGSTENIGYDTYKNNISVPKDSMDIINRAFRNGTTIWHNHDNLGNYSLSNNIVQ